MNAEQWLNYLLPCPKELSIDDSIEIEIAHLAIETVGDANPLVDQAVAELHDLLPQPDETDLPSRDSTFTITLGTPDSQGRLGSVSIDVDFLRACPNAEQAYLIQPVDRGGLAIAALDGRGLYYGTSTLRQLLNVSRSAERILVPLLHVRDWPDLSERGLWNFPDEQNWIPWMADMKLNFGKWSPRNWPHPARTAHPATIDRDLMLESRRRLQLLAVYPAPQLFARLRSLPSLP